MHARRVVGFAFFFTPVNNVAKTPGEPLVATAAVRSAASFSAYSVATTAARLCLHLTCCTLWYAVHGELRATTTADPAVLAFDALFGEVYRGGVPALEHGGRRLCRTIWIPTLPAHVDALPKTMTLGIFEHNFALALVVTADPLHSADARAHCALAERGSLARAHRGVYVERASIVRVHVELPAARAAIRRAAVGALELARRVASADRERLGHLHARTILDLVPRSTGGERDSGSFVDAAAAPPLLPPSVRRLVRRRSKFSRSGVSPAHRILVPKVPESPK